MSSKAFSPNISFCFQHCEDNSKLDFRSKSRQYVKRNLIGQFSDRDHFSQSERSIQIFLASLFKQISTSTTYAHLLGDFV